MAKIMLNGVDYSAPTTGAVSGVKGNAESEYRAGYVNLTPENIGSAEYETGNWTPRLYDGYSNGTEIQTQMAMGTYIKIGTQVHLKGFMAITPSTKPYLYLSIPIPVKNTYCGTHPLGKILIGGIGMSTGSSSFDGTIKSTFYASPTMLGFKPDNVTCVFIDTIYDTLQNS